MAEIQSIKFFLDSTFKIKDLGNLKYFLGLEVLRSSTGIHMSQWKYSLELLEEIGYLACKYAKTLMDCSLKLSKKIVVPLIDSSSYQKLVDKLLYLTITRSNLSFVTNQLSQFLSTPTDLHKKALQWVLKYIKVASGLGLFFPSSFQPSIKKPVK